MSICSLYHTGIFNELTISQNITFDLRIGGLAGNIFLLNAVHRRRSQFG